MKEGHNYRLDALDATGNHDYELLSFVNRGHGCDCSGTNNQEVLRVLINRVQFLESELHWSGNVKIIHHLRMALVLHESRHLERLAERCEIEPENIQTGKNGHYILK